MAEPRSSRRLSCLSVAILLVRATLTPADAAPDPAPAGTGTPTTPQAAAPAAGAPAPNHPAAAASAPPAASPARPPVPTPPPAEIGGDRADAIAHDIVLHPPQKQVPQQGSANLRTVKLKLGGLLDRSVHGAENSEVGRVIDVMVGDDGKPAALVLDVGGFMGVGNRRIAVAWSLFDLTRPRNEPLRVALTEAQVKSAPASVDPGPVTVVTGADAAAPHPVAAAASATPAAVPNAAQPGLNASATPGTPQPGPATPAATGAAPDHPLPVAEPRADTPAPPQPWRAGTPPPPGGPSPSADGRP